jgi:hypothetical protein
MSQCSPSKTIIKKLKNEVFEDLKKKEREKK